MGRDPNRNNAITTFDELLAAARSYSPHLADRLLGARQVLSDENNRAGVQQASSSLRSIMELLPVSLKSKVALTSADREIKASKYLTQLINLLRENQSVHAGTALIEARKIVEEAAHFFTDTLQGGKSKAKETLNAVDPRFSSLPPNIQEQLIGEWTSAWAWFSAVIHNKGQLPEVGELAKHENSIHKVLEMLLGESVMRNIEQIRLLLEREYEADLQELFAELTPFLTYGACYEYFFRRIHSEKWVDILIDEGFFSTPKIRNRSSDILEQQHLVQPLIYLSRIAENHPAKAGLALGHLRRISTPLVKSLVVDVLAKCDGITISESVDNLIEWEIFQTRFVSADSLLILVRKLVAAGFIDSAFRLSAAVLEIPVDEHNGTSQGATFSNWEYGQFCNGLSGILSDFQILEILTTAFRTVESKESLSQVISSIYWFQSFESRRQDRNNLEPKEIVANSIADQIESLISNTHENLGRVLSALTIGKSDFFQRAGFYARRLAAPDFFETSWSTLFDVKLLETLPNISEPWLLAKDLVPFADEDQQRNLASFLEEEGRRLYPDSSAGIPLRIFQILATSGSSVFVSKLEQSNAIYKRDLAPTREARRSFESLQEPYGQWFTSEWIAQAGVLEFVSELENRVPSGQRVSSLMHGIANSLNEVMIENPNFLDGQFDRLSSYPQIVAVLINARGPGILEMAEVEICDLLGLLKRSVEKSFSAQAQTDSTYFPYNDLNKFVRSIFLHRLEKAGSQLIALTWSSLELIVKTASNYTSPSSGFKLARDFYSRALNNGFSSALELGYTCLIISSTHDGNQANTGSTKGLLLAAVKSRNKDLLSGSMLGAYFSQLILVDFDWAMKVLATHKVQSNWQLHLSFFSTYLLWGSPSVASLKEIQHLYKKTFGRQTPTDLKSIRDEVLQVAIRQLGIFYIQGRIALDTVFIENWDTNNDSSLGAQAMGQLGLILSREDAISIEYSTAAASLWNEYSQRVRNANVQNSNLGNAFSPWFTADCLPIDWRVNTVAELLEHGNAVTDDLYGMLETLNSSFDAFPIEVLTLANTLTSDPKARPELSWSMNHISAIVGKARELHLPGVAKPLSNLLETIAKAGFATD